MVLKRESYLNFSFFDGNKPAQQKMRRIELFQMSLCRRSVLAVGVEWKEALKKDTVAYLCSLVPEATLVVQNVRKEFEQKIL